ncbi:hypothetical protein Tco_0979114, partial [Tanacetum coccineum]
TLSSDLDQLSREPCPFHNLKCLKINTSRLQHTDPMLTIPTQIRNYLLGNSPNATFIIDSPQVSQKRPRQKLHEDTLANKVAKLKEKLQNRDEVIIEQKEKIQMLEAAKLQHENFMSHVIKSKRVGLKVQISRHSFLLTSQYEELKSLLLTCIDPSQWAKIEKDLGIIKDYGRTCCNNIGVQSDVFVAELPQALSPSSIYCLNSGSGASFFQRKAGKLPASGSKYDFPLFDSHVLKIRLVRKQYNRLTFRER